MALNFFVTIQKWIYFRHDGITHSSLVHAMVFTKIVGFEFSVVIVVMPTLEALLPLQRGPRLKRFKWLFLQDCQDLSVKPFSA